MSIGGIVLDVLERHGILHAQQQTTKQHVSVMRVGFNLNCTHHDVDEPRLQLAKRQNSEEVLVDTKHFNTRQKSFHLLLSRRAGNVANWKSLKMQWKRQNGEQNLNCCTAKFSFVENQIV